MCRDDVTIAFTPQAICADVVNLDLPLIDEGDRMLCAEV
jgi:hypothetical protein